MDTVTTGPLTISIEQAAALLGVGRTLAYELAQRGEFPGAIRLGRRWLVSRPALERVLNEGRLPDPSESTFGRSLAA